MRKPLMTIGLEETKKRCELCDELKFISLKDEEGLWVCKKCDETYPLKKVRQKLKENRNDGLVFRTD